jgi:hypothetical protein
MVIVIVKYIKLTIKQASLANCAEMIVHLQQIYNIFRYYARYLANNY